MNKTKSDKSRKAIITPYSANMGPQLDYCIHFFSLLSFLYSTIAPFTQVILKNWRDFCEGLQSHLKARIYDLQDTEILLKFVQPEKQKIKVGYNLCVLLNKTGFLTSKLFLEVYNEISSKGRSKFTTRMMLIIHKEKNLHSKSC